LALLEQVTQADELVKGLADIGESRAQAREELLPRLGWATLLVVRESSRTPMLSSRL
jgi:hypothetical protein